MFVWRAVLTPETHEECQPKSQVNRRGLTCVKQSSIGAAEAQRPYDPGRAKPRSYLPIGERARYTQALIVDDRPPKPLTAEARQYQQSQPSMPTIDSEQEPC
jgi:hypothetical protein